MKEEFLLAVSCSFVYSLGSPVFTAGLPFSRRSSRGSAPHKHDLSMLIFLLTAINLSVSSSDSSEVCGVEMGLSGSVGTSHLGSLFSVKEIVFFVEYCVRNCLDWQQFGHEL